VPSLIHATAAANWTLGGSIWTFAFPMILFAVAATVLYRVLWWPHRIPGHSDLVPASSAPPDLGTAHVAAAAAGMTTAAGAGAQPLPPEPHGATEVAEQGDPSDVDDAGDPGDAGGETGPEASE
jgi:hypothetical protein